MKKRVKIDSSILSFVIILTGFLYQFPKLYSTNVVFDNWLDFIGLAIVLKGTVIRMIARGHKKAHSQKGGSLVMTGIYTLTRNPMYLGSFYMGAGFVLIVWPWWTLPIFSWLFYMRFKKQVIKEEQALTKKFGKTFTDYCQNVNRVFPSFDQMTNLDIRKIVIPEEMWNTKEKGGLIGWPILAVVLETLQEKIVFNSTDVFSTVQIFMSAIIIYGAVFWLKYQIFSKKK